MWKLCAYSVLYRPICEYPDIDIFSKFNESKYVPLLGVVAHILLGLTKTYIFCIRLLVKIFLRVRKALERTTVHAGRWSIRSKKEER